MVFKPGFCRPYLYVTKLVLVYKTNLTAISIDIISINIKKKKKFLKITLLESKRSGTPQ